MGVIELDGDFVFELIEAGMSSLVTANDVPHSARDKKVFLHKSQFPSSRDGITGVQDFGNCFHLNFKLHGIQVIALIEDIHVELLRRAGRVQTQIIHRPASVADDRHVAWNTDHDLPVEPHRIVSALPIHGVFNMAVQRNQHRILRTLNLPRRVICSPVVRPFYLLIVPDFLAKKTVFVIDSVSKPRHSQRGQRIQKTGSKSTEPTVPECRICLMFFNVREVHAEFQQHFTAGIEQTKVYNIVAQ